MNSYIAAAIVIWGFLVVMAGALVPSDTLFGVGVAIQFLGMVFLIANYIRDIRENGGLPF
jgi:membrane-bound ClpP family serine protease